MNLPMAKIDRTVITMMKQVKQGLITVALICRWKTEPCDDLLSREEEI